MSKTHGAQTAEREPSGKGAFLQVLSGEKPARRPVWLMRQAGRYLPEYRELRAKAGDFLELCYTPDLAAEVTLQPIRRFGFDAAILFADILLIPQAMGQKLAFVAGEGPRLDPVTDAGRLETLDAAGAAERLSPVYETVARVRASLDPDVALIGFAGAPWTVATYMIAGEGTADQGPARLMAYRDPDFLEALMAGLEEATVDYLVSQVKAGADALQIFDTWAGVLPEAELRRWVIEPTARIVAALRERVPGAPIIGFPKGVRLLLEDYVEKTGIDGVSIGETMPLAEARRLAGPRVALQGNLDPLALIAGGKALEESVATVLKEAEEGPHIFNLGHGIKPETPPEHVSELVRLVRAGDTLT